MLNRNITPHKSRQFIPALGALDGLDNFQVKDFKHLSRLGIDLPKKQLQKIVKELYAMDALQPSITTASIPVPVQFLQEWLPGFVYTVTGKRAIDEFVGMDVVGRWEDEQIVQGLLEPMGLAVPYGDSTNVPLSNWNVNYNYRTVVRFELGMQIERLEEARASRVRIDSAGTKREGAAIQLEIQRNTIGFFGYNNGANFTYGYLNDPGLPAYVTVPNGASGSPLWSRKTTLEIINDILTTIATLRTQSQGLIDPKRVATTMTVPTDSIDYLATTTDLGYSVLKWLSDNYPKIRVVDAPQLNNVNSGANVFYLYADEVQDTSTDNRRTFMQMVPSKFYMLGVEQKAKGYIEDYSNATAGIMLKRPFAVVRRTGI